MSVRQPDGTGTYVPPLTRFSTTQRRGVIQTVSATYAFPMQECRARSHLEMNNRLDLDAPSESMVGA